MTWVDDMKKAQCFIAVGSESLFSDSKCTAQAQHALDEGLEFKILLKEGVTIPDDYPMPKEKDKVEILRWKNHAELNQLLRTIQEESDTIVNINEVLESLINSDPTVKNAKMVHGTDAKEASDAVDSMCALDDKSFYHSIRTTVAYNLKLGRTKTQKWKGFFEGAIITAYLDTRADTFPKIISPDYVLAGVLEMLEKEDATQSEDNKKLSVTESELLESLIEELRISKETPKILYEILLRCSAGLLFMNKDNPYAGCFLVTLAYALAHTTGTPELVKQNTAFNYKRLVLDKVYLNKLLREMMTL